MPSSTKNDPHNELARRVQLADHRDAIQTQITAYSGDFAGRQDLILQMVAAQQEINRIASSSTTYALRW